MNPRERIYLHARIYGDAHQPTPHEAMLVRGDRIAAIGSLAEVEAAAGRGAQRVDLGGHTVLPGFNDAHVHLWKVGDLLTAMLDLRGVQTLAELKHRLAERHRSLPPGAWLRARGYNEAMLREGRHPTARDLDECAAGRPVWLIRTCAHIAVASGEALRAAGINANTPDPAGGSIERDAAGNPTGVLRETAMGLVSRVIPSPSRGELCGMIMSAQHHQRSLGITASTDPAVTPDLIDAYRHLDDGNRLLARTRLLAIRRPDGGTDNQPLPQLYQGSRLKVDGVKFFADGGLSGATAALHRPYKGTGDTGILRFTDDEEFLLLAREAHDAGLVIASHAIGDAAIDQALRIYRRLGTSPTGRNHRVEHFGLPSGDAMRAAAEGPFPIVTQPRFLFELGANFRRYVDDDYLQRVYPYASMLHAGCRVAFSSDAPVVANDNPLDGIRDALARRDNGGEVLNAEERVSIRQAFYAYTTGGAIAGGDAAEWGNLSVGKVADAVVLSADPFANPEAIADLRATQTIFGGEPHPIHHQEHQPA